MRPTPDVDWHFDGPDDGAAYRAEVGRLWGAWAIGMIVLVFGEGWIVWATGIGVIIALLLLARPLQARAASIAPEDQAPGPGMGAFRASRRDQVLRELAFGEAPLVASGAGFGWIWARRIVVGSTLLVFAIVLYDLFVADR